MIEKVSREGLLKTVKYMTKNFPYRLAGSKCEADASVYVTERLRDYGLIAENKEFTHITAIPCFQRSSLCMMKPKKKSKVCRALI